MNRLNTSNAQDKQAYLHIAEKLEYPLGVLRLLNDTNLFNESLNYAIKDLEALIGEATDRLKDSSKDSLIILQEIPLTAPLIGGKFGANH